MEGLLTKYFVLNPNKRDEYGDASRAAMRTYAEKIESENPALARDLHAWVTKLEPHRGTTPRIGSAWPDEGGVYAGTVRGDDGAPDYHLIIADAAREKINWKDALAWAKALNAEHHVDFELPERKELAVLFGNVPELFAKEWYWSAEQSASNYDYAWCQSFYDGTQYGSRKLFELRARAVRRLPIQ